MKNEIKVIYKEPASAPIEKTIPNTLEALQGLVGGYIESLTVATDLAVIVNEEGRLQDLPYNMDLCGVSLVGPVVFVGVDGENFTDVPDGLQGLFKALRR